MKKFIISAFLFSMIFTLSCGVDDILGLKGGVCDLAISSPVGHPFADDRGTAN